MLKGALLWLKYVLVFQKTLCLGERAEVQWGITPLLTSTGTRYPCTLWVMMHSSEVSKLPVSHWILTRYFSELCRRENGPRSRSLRADPEKERTKFQFHCSDFMLSHNCRASFPAYKLKSSSQYIFASIITYPCNSILTVSYTVC